ncbi:hypothetical protein HGRIS_005385 [Hohenbuehelia grisea]|uniref:Zn(2)-C6 fungal-type domain-containing protein n=1 Tax=Hohenbuehelia grisea TaxID=104357 RepID=A0ABR3JFR2_9AGAR
MPVEPSKAKLKRRNSRRDFEDFKFDGTHARELEMKRSRGEVSCAECRRLKIKCDKQIPCQSCQRRGCAALCPNGSLATGQGTRFVLAATEHLHRRISRLSARIRQLEDALADLQARHSKDPHPLLHEDLLAATDDENDGTTLGDEPMGAAPPEVIDAFGTLSISDHGISRFFGPTGGSESLLLANSNPSTASPASPGSPSHRTSTPLSTELSHFSRSFPFTPLGTSIDVQASVEKHLPPWERANSLCNTYFDQAGWLFRGVTKEQLLDEMLPAIYHKSTMPYAMTDDYAGPHDLSLLFTVMAVGSLVESEPIAGEAEHFHQLSQIAICLQPVLEKPSIVTIQTLHLMSIYTAMSGTDLTSETSMEMSWSLIYLATQLSQTVHRDSARWGLSPTLVQRRRILFWDLFVADAWTSLNTGRPPSFSLAYIDCGYPQYEGDPKDHSGESRTGFENWQFRFAAECVADVAARTLTAEAPSYATIMELDRKVREFSLPPLPDRSASSSGASAKSLEFSVAFQRCVLDHIRETVLLYIHRSFFAQAIIDQPANPLKSAYAPSFLAAYRASSTILKSVKEQFHTWPTSSARFWSMWTFAFSAAVVFGTVVTRGPRSPLATSAMGELDQACILFSKAAVHSKRARKALPILTKLSEKARYALASAQTDSSANPNDGGLLWNIKQEEPGDDELDIFAGRTRFVSGKRPSATSSSSSSSPPMAYDATGQTIYAHDPHQHVPNPQSQAQVQVHISQQHAVPSQVPLIVTPSQYEAQAAMDSWSSAETPRQNQYMHAASAAHQRSSVPAAPYPPVPCYPNQHQYAGSADFSWPSAPDRHPHQHSQQQQISYAPRHPSMPSHHYNLNNYPPAPQTQPLPSITSHSSHPSLHHPSRHQQHHHSQMSLPQQQMYATTPAFRDAIMQPANAELAELGLAARDSRLDARWSSFMEDSGLLDDVNFRQR